MRIGREVRIYNQYFLSVPSAGVAGRTALIINLDTFETKEFNINDVPLQDIGMYGSNMYTIGNLNGNTRILQYNINDGILESLTFERELIMTFNIHGNYMYFFGESFNDENFGEMTFYVVDLNSFTIIRSIHMGNDPFGALKMIVYGDTIYFPIFYEDSSVYLLTMDKELENFEKISLDFLVPSGIRFYDGKFYFFTRSTDRILVYDIATGAQYPHTLAASYIDVVVHDGRIYLFGRDFANLYIHSAEDMSFIDVIDISSQRGHVPQGIFINPNRINN